jgi:hypothetical protein
MTCARLMAAILVSVVVALMGYPLIAAPRVFLLDGEKLEVIRQEVRSGDDRYAAAMARLRQDAAEAMERGPYSVTNKKATPPSGDKRDYMSLGPYWWPNPNTPDGLPYVRRDGERNPEIDEYPDARYMGNMTGAVETLSQAYFFAGEEAYAKRAALLLRKWFLDDGTRMNPHLEYGQAIRGINTGRGIGIIQTRGLVRIIDAVGMLEESQAWTNEDQDRLVEWFDQYLTWLLKSTHGKDEAAAENNHGTYYDLQVAAIGLFVGKQELATEVLRAVGPRRIAVQITSDGRQSLELARTNSWSYSIGNLVGLMSLAEMAEHQAIDLWRYESPEGGSIRKAIDFLLPAGLGKKRWAYKQIGNWSPRSFHSILLYAEKKYPNGPYRSLRSRTPSVNSADRSQLLSWPLGLL